MHFHVEILNLLKAAEIEQALALLEDQLGPKTEIIVWRGSWAHILKERRLGIISTEDFNRCLSRQISVMAEYIEIESGKVNKSQKLKEPQFQIFPKTYLNSIPKIIYKAHIHCHKYYWDTGITAKMLEGSNVYEGKIMEIILQLLSFMYEDPKTILDDINTNLSAQMQGIYESLYEEDSAGGFQMILARGQRHGMIEEVLLTIVDLICSPTFFDKEPFLISWKQKWENALDLGQKGTEIDTEITSLF